ncbi:MAG: hypothetical protein QNJ38_19450 [Prochloraceae cyanobacterium]|nr:hypothetical protein [Prochloraceae cyanobacterium]
MNQRLEQLEIRIGFIQERMAAIRASGKVAPPKTWIQRYYVKKSNGKKYYYYRLMAATNRRSRSGKIQGKVKLYLGNKDSSQYKSYKAAIARRNELKFLQSRCDRLMEIYSVIVTNLVGKGQNQKNPEKEKSINYSIVEDKIAAVVEKLEASNEQLWYCLRAIAQRLGIMSDSLSCSEIESIFVTSSKQYESA